MNFVFARFTEAIYRDANNINVKGYTETNKHITD